MARVAGSLFATPILLEMNSNVSLLPNSSEFSLRPPLEPSVSTNDHTPQIRPLLYRMYIACYILRLGTEARFSALVFLHRYIRAVAKENTKNSHDRTDWRWVCAACLFLACKASEEPRRLRDVINLAHMMEWNETDGTINLQGEPPHLNEQYWEAKKKIVETEQVVLRWLAFDVSVSHPHRAVFLLLEKEGTRDELMPVAFRRLNDILFHGPALQHSVLELASAAIELAREEVQVGNADMNETTVTENWLKQYNISNESFLTTKNHLIEATNLLKEYSSRVN